MIVVTLSQTSIDVVGHADGPVGRAVCASVTTLMYTLTKMTCGYTRTGVAKAIYGSGNEPAKFVVAALRNLACGRGEHIKIKGKAPWETRKSQ